VWRLTPPKAGVAPGFSAATVPRVSKHHNHVSDGRHGISEHRPVNAQRNRKVNGDCAAAFLSAVPDTEVRTP